MINKCKFNHLELVLELAFVVRAVKILIVVVQVKIVIVVVVVVVVVERR